jgi:hypothetical protein
VSRPGSIACSKAVMGLSTLLRLAASGLQSVHLRNLHAGVTRLLGRLQMLVVAARTEPTCLL